ncbi:AfsR/SARP family transcriptional regulator [Allokutzneria albata]|uniref:DNA-binding transcriptional activator of the SARP family n=1 Tax=Allokutzneria albata TaxID=211114 RepID=A0A1G9UJ67_ALLAB|nr:AfsR/SARP family transcriptional regulator [Allokutzneria albata]SDM59844.1 DNA-binding transcriptional activator of the SARP family [Allokutzneria albata]
MEFLVLGPMEVRARGQVVEPGGPRQRAVLAALLMRANALATPEFLVDAAWVSPPATPESNLRSYVSGLRRRLGDDGARLITRPGGYLLRVDAGELDLARFDRLVERAREADGRTAADLLGQALALWRGRPLEGLAAGPALVAELARLEERHHAVVDDYVRVRFELGEHAEVVGELRRLTAIHPLRERLWEHLMGALHRSGRRADALAAFHEVRALLERELNVSPGPRLRQLHAEIAGARYRPGRGPLRQLPSEADHLTGREAELRDVIGLLAAERDRLAVVTVSGPPGVGKSAFAVAAAHRLASRYPDGQLFVDLSGGTAHPLDPGEVLARFLRDLGVPGVDVPPATAERAALFRDRISDRRVLVVLDNAAGDAQVRPLLPGSPRCGVVITSRRRLTGLDASLRVQLDPLDPADALRLLGDIADAAHLDPPAARRIVSSCGHLPLAIRIIGTKLRTRPHLDVATLAARLEDERHRLDELVAGDREVRAGFLVSYERLSPDQRRAFRLLALLPGPDFPGWAAAAALDVDGRTAERLLDDLVEANLVEAGSRYRFHDLIRLLAEERAAAETTAAERKAVFDRIFDAYLHVARGADVALPFGGLHRLALPRPATEIEALAEHAARNAPRWFDEELHCLLRAVELASEQGRHLTTCRLSATLAAYLELRGRWDELVTVAKLSVAAANELGSDYWSAYAYFGLGLAARERHDLEPARRYFAQCLSVLPGADDPRLEMVTSLAVAVGLRFVGCYADSERSLHACLDRLSTMDEPNWVAYARRELGILHRYRGDWARAEELLRAAVDEFALLGDDRWEAASLRELGVVKRELGDHETALRLVGTAREIFHSLGEVRREAMAWRSLAHTHLRLGDTTAARTCCDRSRELYARTLDTHGAACTEVLYGELHASRAEGIRHIQRALSTFQALGDPRWTGKARLGLAALLAATGRADEAAAVRAEAHVALSTIGAVEARQNSNTA